MKPGEVNQYTQTREFSWCHLHRHWWQGILSSQQPLKPPIMTTLVSWQLSILSIHSNVKKCQWYSSSFVVCGVMSSLQWRYNERGGISDHRRLDCLHSRFFRRRSKKTSKLCVTGLCEGNSPVTGEFTAQRASNAENVSIWWRHHEIIAQAYEGNSSWWRLEMETLFV